MTRFTLVILTVLIVGCMPALAVFEDFEDDLDPSDWTLLGTAYVDNGMLILTEDMASQGGALYWNEEFNPVDEVHVSFTFQILSASVGADGATFSLANSIDLGLTGGRLGWEGPGVYGVEFDTYANGFDPIQSPHISIIDSTVENHVSYAAFDFQPNTWYTIEIIILDGNFQVRVDLDEPINFDFTGFDPDQPLYLGLTAATGAIYDSYVFDNFQFDVEQGPVNLNLIGTTTVIPPQGGALVYDAVITSELPQPRMADAWTSITFPNGQIFGPLVRLSGVIPTGETSFTGLMQNLPAHAPAGTYTFRGSIGLFPNFVADSDVVTFYKEGTAAEGVDNWDGSDWVITDDDGTAPLVMPDHYEMSTAYPNPFNPSTSVAVSLPQTSDLTVQVYNVEGQLVGTLANGKFFAGQHNFRFDASNLASGLYFIQAQVPGQLNEIQKVTLMK